MRRVVAILACHDRRAKTIECLERILLSSASAELSAVVFDDGSADGTAEAVHSRFGAAVEVLNGDGSAFWNGGMRLAMNRAVEADPDFILWINDDTMIHPGALDRLLCTHDERACSGGLPPIVVAAISDPSTGELTYSGLRREGPWWRPLAVTKVRPSEDAQRCDTMNGNCVLIPREAWLRVGSLDAGFVHGLGDFDYGFRARRAGFPIWVAPGVLGECSRNASKGTFLDGSLPVRERWRLLTGPKGLPVPAWLRYARRHGGLLWPLHFLWPYAKVFFAVRNGRQSGPA